MVVASVSAPPSAGPRPRPRNSEWLMPTDVTAPRAASSTRSRAAESAKPLISRWMVASPAACHRRVRPKTRPISASSSSGGTQLKPETRPAPASLARRQASCSNSASCSSPGSLKRTMMRDERRGITSPIGTPAVYSKMKISGRGSPDAVRSPAGTALPSAATSIMVGNCANMWALRSSRQTSAGAPSVLSTHPACGPTPPRA